MTLWGPTHLMLIGGAAMTLVGIAVLTVEGMRSNADSETPVEELLHTKMARAIALTGGLMLGLSTFQAEFDFGVPQFQLIFQPMLLMLAAGVGLVLARVYAGPGAALGAAGFFILLRGGLALADRPRPRPDDAPLPALHRRGGGGRGGRPLRLDPERPLRFGLVSGIGIGTVGLAAEWAWSHLWMPLPWPESAFPEAAIVGFAAAIAGATIGAWIGTHLCADPAAALAPPAPRRALQRRGPGGAGRLRPLHPDPGGSQRPGCAEGGRRPSRSRGRSHRA